MRVSANGSTMDCCWDKMGSLPKTRLLPTCIGVPAAVSRLRQLASHATHTALTHQSTTTPSTTHAPSKHHPPTPTRKVVRKSLASPARSVAPALACTNNSARVARSVSVSVPDQRPERLHTTTVMMMMMMIAVFPHSRQSQMACWVGCRSC